MAARWDSAAPDYDLQFDHVIRSPAERAAWDRVFRLVEDGRRRLAVLDVGTGTGFLALELAARGHRVTGIDLAGEMLQRAEAKAADHGLTIAFRLGDAERPPFPPAQFDLVVSRHVFWAMSDPPAVLTEWARVLRPGGRLAILDGHWGAYDEPPNPSSLAAQDVAALLHSQGLSDVRIDHLKTLTAALEARAHREGHPIVRSPRYLVWGRAPG